MVVQLPQKPQGPRPAREADDGVIFDARARQRRHRGVAAMVVLVIAVIGWLVFGGGAGSNRDGAGAAKGQPAAAAGSLPVPVVGVLPARQVTLSYRRAGLQVVGLTRSLFGLSNRPDADPLLELNTGRHGWRDVTPAQVRAECAHGCWVEFQTAFFLSRSVGWVTAYNLLSGQDDLYGTTDGGRSWQFQLRTGHSENAGAQLAVWFISARDGWAAVLEPTGPAARAWRTHDGGARWTPVPDNRTLTRSGHNQGWVPMPYEFISKQVGYAAEPQPEGVFTHELARTSDGGWIWRAQTVSLPGWAARAAAADTYPGYSISYLLPVFSNARDGVLAVLLPATGKHGATVRFYGTTNGGVSWKFKTGVAVNTATFRPPHSSVTTPLEPLVSIVNSNTWWVAYPPGPGAKTGDEPRVSTNAGRSWTQTTSNLPADGSQLTAVSATQASATVQIFYGRTGNSVSELEQTTNQGRDWQILKQG
ncbi:MAG: hypothetical protein ACP5H2_10700 [Solirubrobacteraceae bacterium]